MVHLSETEVVTAINHETVAPSSSGSMSSSRHYLETLSLSVHAQASNSELHALPCFNFKLFQSLKYKYASSKVGAKLRNGVCDDAQCKQIAARRDSEPTNTKSKDVKPNLITASHVTPVAAAISPQSVEKSDPVAHERNMEGHKEELKRLATPKE